MAKGKYRTAAEAREVRETALQEVQRLRRESARLASEVERLDRENLEQQAAHLSETRHLRQLIAAATSERLAQVEEQHRELAEQHRLALATVDEIQGNWNAASSKMIGHLQSCLGAHEDAVQTFLEWMGHEAEAPLYTSDGEEIAARKFGADGVQALRRARRKHTA